MPQIMKSIELPMFVEIIDKETKYSGDPHFRIASVISENVNKDDYDRDIALNCDNFNRNIAIKEEPVDSFEITEHFTLNNCDTTTTTTTTTTSSSTITTTTQATNNETVNRLNNGGNKRATNSTTTYLCHRCKESFGSRDLFEVHYRQAYNEPIIYTCHICEKQMKNKRSYQRHFNRHFNRSQKYFACTNCSKKFTQEKLLKKHNESIHNLTTPKSCYDCKEEFSDLFKFKAHRRTHHAQNKKQQLYQCADCGKIMKNRSSLSMHSRIHSNDRQYVCMVCEQKFVQKINLINHLKVHNSTKTHLCNECGKSFVGQSQLMRHTVQHTNVRAFGCEICKKFYKTKRDLKLHLMVHSTHRPHACHICEKTFLSTSKLKQHLNIHSGTRPFVCKFCPKDFTNFPNWLKHTRRRHKVDHKTGEKLIVLPNFLNKPNKTNKAGKMKTTKRAAKSVVACSDGGGGSGSNNNNININNNNNSNQHGIDTSKTVKAERTEVMTTTKQCNETAYDSGTTAVAGDANRSPSQTNYDQRDNNVTEPVDKCNMPFVVTKSGSDLSTITVNNRTLPLNTSDDLERAAALLMHQTLDLEDDLEFVNIKSEIIDPMDAIDDEAQGFVKPQSHSNGLPPDFPNFHGPDFLYYSYYSQATQCDFAMMPLPPINTVKRKLKGIATSSTIFPGMTNVL